ncbi:phospholipase A2, membrane associated-like [Acomys russatus]|uniref:phospholipase A2, membrane associated-like n=1 Tax=Acomys russatus TaxID=60746 RepID=UPI0021E32DB5|nr:phospholipase A2, membrane associated-like [Acomys russatus]
MKVLLLLAAVIMAFGPIQIQGSLSEFTEMVRRTTGMFVSQAYNYGCYCGPGGSGSPKDGTDWCCFAHKCCYYDLEKHGCNTTFLHYKFTSEMGIINCAENQDSCKKELCQCDKVAAECFAQNFRSYSKRLRYYPKVLCNGKPPKC